MVSDLFAMLGALTSNFDYWIDFFVAWLMANLAVLLGI